MGVGLFLYLNLAMWNFMNTSQEALPFYSVLSLIVNDTSLVFRRAAWEDNQIVYLATGSYDANVPRPEAVKAIPSNLFEEGFQGSSTRLPNFVYYNKEGIRIEGWNPTQEDILSQDWYRVVP
jgi:hypothetical protein